jgi:putative endonuclease
MLYIGMTNNLQRRIYEHEQNRGKQGTYAGENYCYILIYHERFFKPEHAIKREKQLKKWSRTKKETLINSLNPNWNSLNHNLF